MQLEQYRLDVKQIIKCCNPGINHHITLVMKEQAVLKNINDFENKSLLLVDDDNPFRERLARAMEKKGFDVIQAEGVKKGIETVKIKKPGFAVVDLRLADGNGLEVVKQIQSNKNEGL